MAESPSTVPALPGLAVAAVEWLPSGAESGLVRVRGRWTDESAREPDLPILALRAGGGEHRFDSLPDARFNRDPATWRGTYLVPAELVAVDPEGLWLEWPSGARSGLPALTRGVEPPPVPAAPERPEVPDEPGGQVIDRAVLAERRARRAEAAEQAQAKVAAEALKAVEVLELRSAELERRLEQATAERDALPPPEPEGSREALAAALASAAELRSRSREWQLRLRTSEVAHASDAVRLAVLEADRASFVRTGELEAVRRELAVATQAATAARNELESADRRFDEARTAWDRRRSELETALAKVRTAQESLRAELDEARRRAADERAGRDELRGRVTSLESAVADAEARVRVESVARTTLEDELDRERIEARTALESARTSFAAELERERAESRAARESFESELARERAARESFEADLGRERAARASLEAEVQQERATRASLEAEVQEERATRESFAAELERERVESRAARKLLEAQLGRERATRASLEAEVERERATRASLEAEVEQERATRESFEAELERARAEAEQTLQERIAELERRGSPDQLERLAREQAEASAAAAPAADTSRLVADLDAAAEALRRRPVADSDEEPPAPDAEPAVEWGDRREGEREPCVPGVEPVRGPSETEEPLPWGPPGFDRSSHDEPDEPPAPDAEPGVEWSPPLEPPAAFSPPVPSAVIVAPAPPPEERAVATPEAAPLEEPAVVAPAPPPQERAVAAPEVAPLEEPVSVAELAQGVAPSEPASPAVEPAAKPAGPVIVSATKPPARGLVLGSDRRDYPLLRGAIVKLAHDDPAIAARLLAALLPAQGALIEGPLAYDVTIREGATYGVAIAGGRASIERLEKPHSRGVAEFHLIGDAVTLAELLAGVDHRIGRFFGPVRARGRKRRLKDLRPLTDGRVSLTDAAKAGARLDPELVYRVLGYAVHPSWTRGHAFTIAQEITGDRPETWYLTATDGAGVTVSSAAPRPPTATVSMGRDAFDRLLREETVPPGRRPCLRGDLDAVAQMREWIRRVRAG